MFGKKGKELEETIARQLEQLNERDTLIAQLRGTIEEYRAKETAIAGALTRAQTDAGKIVEEARVERTLILRDANTSKAAAEAEAATVLQNAKRQADAAIEDAQRRAEDAMCEAERKAAAIGEEAERKAKESAQRAEAFMESYRESARKLNASMRKAAALAAQQAEQFGSFVGGISLEDEIELAGEYRGAADMDGDVATPEEYESPAELMKSIYRIENRPVSTADAAPEYDEDAHEGMSPGEGEHVGPAYHHWKEHSGGLHNGKYHPELAHDHYHGPNAMVKEEFAADEASEAEAETVEDDDVEADETEQAVWTVDEIVEQAAPAQADQIDAELNAIIDDVLKGS